GDHEAGPDSPAPYISPHRTQCFSVVGGACGAAGFGPLRSLLSVLDARGCAALPRALTAGTGQNLSGPRKTRRRRWSRRVHSWGGTFQGRDGLGGAAHCVGVVRGAERFGA